MCGKHLIGDKNYEHFSMYQFFCYKSQKFVKPIYLEKVFYTFIESLSVYNIIKLHNLCQYLYLTNEIRYSGNNAHVKLSIISVLFM